MPDNFIDVDDIPMPDASEADGIEDAFGHQTAFKFSFIGVGQGGGRLAEQFYKMGYRRVCAINTTDKDMAHLTIPEQSKLVVHSHNGAGRDGAGKDPSVADAAINGHIEDAYDLMKRCWGNTYDYAFVCLGAGGGTGAGASQKVTEIAKQLMSDQKLPAKVGVIVALPKNDEGHKVASNSLDTLRKLEGSGLSPVVVIDNERIKQIYPKTTVAQFWDVANRGICTLLHLFNKISAQASSISAFDPADFATLLDSGVVAFGAAAVATCQSQADISKAIRQQLQANVLASVDLSKGKHAGCIFIANSTMLDTMPQEYLDHGFEMLSRILSPDSTIHRGIYVGNNNDLRVYTMIGGLPFPATRQQELSRLAGQNSDYAGG